MSVVNDGICDLRAATADALRHARAVRVQIVDTVIPILPPARRSFADWLARELDRGAFFDETALRDIDAFTALIQREIDVGTYVGWEADEHHVRGGYETIELDARARSLVPALAELTQLQNAVANVLDVSRAATIVDDMTSD